MAFQPAIYDFDFRSQHPEIDDEDWSELFCAAIKRREHAFLLSLNKNHPELFEYVPPGAAPRPELAGPTDDSLPF